MDLVEKYLIVSFGTFVVLFGKKIINIIYSRLNDYRFEIKNHLLSMVEKKQHMLIRLHKEHDATQEIINKESDLQNNMDVALEAIQISYNESLTKSQLIYDQLIQTAQIMHKKKLEHIVINKYLDNVIDILIKHAQNNEQQNAIRIADHDSNRITNFISLLSQQKR